jgi:hypothetical protein
MTDNMKTVRTQLQFLRQAPAQAIAKAASLSLEDTYTALVALESEQLARVKVSHDSVGIGYYREWVAT